MGTPAQSLLSQLTPFLSGLLTSRCTAVKTNVGSKCSYPGLNFNPANNSQSGKTGAIEVLSTSLRNEGFRFLFKGWTPAFIRLGPNTIFMFVFLEVWGLRATADMHCLILVLQQLKKGWRTLSPAN